MISHAGSCLSFPKRRPRSMGPGSRFVWPGRRGGVITASRFPVSSALPAPPPAALSVPSMFITSSIIKFQRGVGDLERLSGFKQALEAGQDGGPSLGDAFQEFAALDEAF